MALLERVARFVGRSVYDGKTLPTGQDIESAAVVKIREILGGQLQMPPQTVLQWFLEEVDEARVAADRGDLTQAGRLLRALRGDALVSGLLRTKAGGTIRLPKKWRGDESIVEQLTSAEVGSITDFDLLCPPNELQAMAEDADFLRVAIGELCPVVGRPFPVLRRLDPEFLYFNWAQNRWYFKSPTGLLNVEAGDRRWVLHLAGPATAPWQFGSWNALGRTWVRKDSCQHLKSNWEFTLANPARIAKSPQGAAREQRLGFFHQLAAWGINSVFALPAGWDAAILESKGEGWQGFDSSIKSYNEEIMIALAGQLVSITGGTGFSSEDLYASVRFDLIRDTAVPLAFTINTQILPAYVVAMHGEEALDECPSFEFEVKRPDDLKAEAAALTALGQALNKIVEVAKTGGLKIDLVGILAKFGIKADPDELSAIQRLSVPPTALLQALRIRELREAIGIDPLGDDRDDELAAQASEDKSADNDTVSKSPDGDSSMSNLRRVA